ncbi:hypothetical protein [Roseibium alexandrii]|uniref:hypothetical protein n=1 Tax=Roseibium alexandrii TaxID=388408 RepID=UPI00375099BE
MNNKPIDEKDFLLGVKVVNIGDVRVSRGKTRRPASSCRHKRLTYDAQERRIWCRDCEQDIDPFDAFVGLVEQYDGALKRLEADRLKLQEAQRFQVRSIAAKEIDKAWRSRNMVPSCPHCGNGLFPEDFKHGVAMLGKDYAKSRLK